MIINAETANKLFDIIANEGKHSQRYIDHHREEFVETISTKGMNEFWYPTDAGSSIKVYFDAFSSIPVVFHAQTINTVHDKTLIQDVNRALISAFSRN